MRNPPTHRYVPKGRRPSVATTTERRSPSARRRPGVGFLPARLSAARVAGTKSRREHFQVFSEDEFFSQGIPGDELLMRGPARPQVPRPAPAFGVRAVLAICSAGASLSLVLAIALGVVAPARSVRRKTALRSTRVQRDGIGARHLDGRPHRRLPGARPRSPHRTRSIGSQKRRAPRVPARPAATNPGVSASASAEVGPSRPTPVLDASTEGRPATSAAPAEAKDAATRPEFGFER